MVGRNILDAADPAELSFISPSSQELDLTDKEATEAYLMKVKPDIVVHAAGKVGGIQANIANPVDFLVKNTEIGINVVMASYSAGVEKLLNIGSSCMYPRNATNPLKEDDILNGSLEKTNEGYALAKVLTSKLCEYISTTSGTKHIPKFQYKTIIPCNQFGKYDKFAPETAHLLPSIIRKVHEAKERNLPTVEIWGDGSARREFMYAGDLADAVISCLRRFVGVPQTMNIGMGYDLTVLEYYKAVSFVIGWKGTFTFNTDLPEGMKRKIVDISKQTNFGWHPQTSILEAIRNTYEYYLENEL